MGQSMKSELGRFSGTFLNHWEFTSYDFFFNFEMNLNLRTDQNYRMGMEILFVPLRNLYDKFQHSIYDGEKSSEYTINYFYIYSIMRIMCKIIYLFFCLISVIKNDFNEKWFSTIQSVIIASACVARRAETSGFMRWIFLNIIEIQRKLREVPIDEEKLSNAVIDYFH